MSKVVSLNDSLEPLSPPEQNQNPEVGAPMEVQSGRVEKRFAMSVPVWITSLEHPGAFERATTVNVSSAGARIEVSAAWQPNEGVVVLAASGCIANAQVVYSQPLPGQDGFAIGVRLQQPPSTWPVSKTAQS